MKSLYCIIIWSLFTCIIPFDLKAQLIKVDFDSTTVYNAGFAEFSLSRKFEHELIKEERRFYDYGISINLISMQLNKGLYVGLNPFYDIHVVDNAGYEKLGTRLFLDLRNNSGSGFKAAFGYVLKTNNLPVIYSVVKPGFSTEFTYYFDWELAITGKWDRINTERFLKENAGISDVSLGIKFAPKGFVSALGYVFGLASMSYNAMLRST